ncbi:MAG: hypothetical protein KME30_32180 [Iphinoe sp. HA4291-MV1]|jgi:hypothetical protein|nr:hypothetical protein [Iphinoe sp. HA4291-MV1]
MTREEDFLKALKPITSFTRQEIWNGIKINNHLQTNMPMLAWLQITMDLDLFMKDPVNTWRLIDEQGIRAAIAHNQCFDWFVLTDLREIYRQNYQDNFFPLGLIAGRGSKDLALWSDSLSSTSLLFQARLPENLMESITEV